MSSCCTYRQGTSGIAVLCTDGGCPAIPGLIGPLDRDDGADSDDPVNSCLKKRLPTAEDIAGRLAGKRGLQVLASDGSVSPFSAQRLAVRLAEDNLTREFAERVCAAVAQWADRVALGVMPASMLATAVRSQLDLLLHVDEQVDAEYRQPAKASAARQGAVSAPLIMRNDGLVSSFDPDQLSRDLAARGVSGKTSAHVADAISRWIGELQTSVLPSYLFDAAVESQLADAEKTPTTREKAKDDGGKGQVDGRERGPSPGDIGGPRHIYGHDIEITRPLIFIPGILGSRLFRKRPGEADEQIFPPSPMVDDGWKASFERLSMHDPLVPAGPDEPAGLTDGAYTELIHFLTGNLGFRLGINFWIFAYNWMESNRSNGQKLAVFINDSILAQHPEWPSVDVICHSMGGLVLRAAIKMGDSRGQPARVGRSMYLASPHYGAPKAYFFLKTGVPIMGGMLSSFLAEQAWKRARDQGEPGLEEGVKKLARSCRSVYELLPDEYYFRQKQSIVKVSTKFYKSDYDVTGLTNTYYADPYAKFDDDQLATVREAMQFKTDLGESLPGDYKVLYNSEVQPTNDTVWYTIRSAWWSTFLEPFDSGQHGDGTVPTISGKGPGGTLIPGPGTTHCALPNIEETFKQIVEYLFPNPKGK